MADINMEEAKANLNARGFLDLKIDATLDLFKEINRLKREKNAIILAHYYQEPDIQDIADFIGDSLALAQKAQSTEADIIVFAGVHFMAETAKILNPSKRVLLPDLHAGCSLADSTPADAFRKFKEDHPDYVVITYINCSAEIKALSDIICTSSNAEVIVNSLPEDQKIIFAPDKNLGAWVNKRTGRNMVLWDGACMVHELFNKEKITRLKHRHPAAQIIAHPECQEAILEVADFVGSTKALLEHTKNSSHQEFIVATESGILHQMQFASPQKTFIPAPPDNLCACNDCPYMKLNTLEKVYLCMEYELPELLLSDALIETAYSPMQKMLDISKQAGL